MELTYTISVDSVKTGSKKHYWHRYKWSFVRGCVIMLAVIALGVYQHFQGEKYGVMFICGGLMALMIRLIGVLRWPQKSANLVFQKNTDPKTIHMKCDDEGLFIDSQNSSGLTKWDAFCEVVPCEGGIILYISKVLHMWIPEEAEFTEGSWTELCDLLQKKVTKESK